MVFQKLKVKLDPYLIHKKIGCSANLNILKNVLNLSSAQLINLHPTILAYSLNYYTSPISHTK